MIQSILTTILVIGTLTWLALAVMFSYPIIWKWWADQ